MTSRSYLGGVVGALLTTAAVLGAASQLRAESDAAAGKLRDVLPTKSAREPQSATVTIQVLVYPSARATVSWGRKRLGIIRPQGSLTVKRPRDSGPLDLMIRAEGYLPVQTRAYTFDDTKLQVRLTPVDQVNTLLGYREPVDAGVDGGDDAGAYASDAGVAADASGVQVPAQSTGSTQAPDAGKNTEQRHWYDKLLPFRNN